MFFFIYHTSYCVKSIVDFNTDDASTRWYMLLNMGNSCINVARVVEYSLFDKPIKKTSNDYGIKKHRRDNGNKYYVNRFK